MRQNENANFRRLICILCYIGIIAEYRLNDKLRMLYNINLEFVCDRKIECLDLFIETTTEALITFKEIDQFISTILNPQLKDEMRTSLKEYGRKIFCDISDCFKPRPLKHLVRCKIRECLRNSAVLPEVHHLPLPVSLKKFITFEETSIWQTLKGDQLILYFVLELNRMLPNNDSDI